MSFTIVERLVTFWLAYFYLDERSPGHVPISATAFFGVLWIGRLVDAVTDPLVASFSDRTRHRLGRRRLFMLAGGLPMCCFGALIFFPPPSRSTLACALYLALTLGLFWACFTVYAVAFLALMSELATTHRTRVQLATMKAFAALLAAALVFVLSPQLIGPLGFGRMVLVMALLALVTAYVPVLGIDEAAHAVSGSSSAPLLRSMRLVLADRPFQRYLISFLLFWLGFNVVTTGIPFYVRHLLGEQESSAGTLMGFTFAGAALAFLPLGRLALHLGLRRSYLLCMLLFTAILSLIYFWDSPPLGLAPSTVARSVMALAGLPVAGLLVIPDAIVSRLSRLAAEREGQGREAMYFGFQGFCLKLTFGLSGSLMGLLFDLFGKGGSSGKLGLKLTGPAGALCVLLGLFLFWKYPGGAQEILDEMR
jgi:GPH family glycoside/pentoside/hexuronide:cation symporter